MMEALVCHPLGEATCSGGYEVSSTDSDHRHDQSPHATFKASPRTRGTFDPMPTTHFRGATIREIYIMTTKLTRSS
jgi:hypothetical protein